MNDKERLTELAREIRRQYYRDWRAKNKERVKSSNARYWEKRAQMQKTREDVEKGEN